MGEKELKAWRIKSTPEPIAGPLAVSGWCGRDDPSPSPRPAAARHTATCAAGSVAPFFTPNVARGWPPTAAATPWAGAKARRWERDGKDRRSSVLLSLRARTSTQRACTGDRLRVSAPAARGKGERPPLPRSTAAGDGPGDEVRTGSIGGMGKRRFPMPPSGCLRSISQAALPRTTSNARAAGLVCRSVVQTRTFNHTSGVSTWQTVR